MRLGSIGVRGCLALGVVVLAVACDQSPTAPSTPTGAATPGRAIRSIEVVGPTVVSTGETARYTAFAQYSDGARDDVTGAVQWAVVGLSRWSSGDPARRAYQVDSFTVEGVVSASAIRGTFDGDLLYFNSETDRNEPTWYCRAKDHAVTLQR